MTRPRLPLCHSSCHPLLPKERHTQKKGLKSFTTAKRPFLAAFNVDVCAGRPRSRHIRGITLRWFWPGTSVTWRRREWCRWIAAGCWRSSWVSCETATFPPLSSSHIWLSSHIRTAVAAWTTVLHRLPLLLFLGFEFFETSAKDNINVKQTFERLVDLICDKMSESLDSDPAVTTGAPTAKLTDSDPPLQQPGCNC